MCGIAGIYEFQRRDGDVRDDVLRQMRETLVHRGPDGDGLYVSGDRRIGLAHRRLAIVDIEGGTQPMFGRDESVLVFNGEIYNYPDLRRQLERDGVEFDTHCDTEVILRLYERYGQGLLEHLNGMFAFALWDARARTLFFARDRVGEKPFYWTNAGGVFIFGSEIKALLAHPLVHPAVNESAISPYLTNLVVPSPETLYKGIYKLPAGHKGTCNNNGIEIAPYWDLFGDRQYRDVSREHAKSKVRELLQRSVDARLMADVPVGVLLSGGVDSSTIVALLREKAANMATFSVGFPNGTSIDERDEARKVARYYRTDHHEIEVSETDALGFLGALIHHQDEPLADPVCVPLHFVCKLAARHGVKVVLAGEGADELFWGYPRYTQILSHARWMRQIASAPRPARMALARLVPPNSRPHLRELLEGLAQGRPFPMHMPTGLSAYHRRLFLRSSLGVNEGWSARPGTGSDEDFIDRLGWDTQEFQFGLRLPELLLMRIDRFSMANSVEARVPFLAPDLVEFGYSLPAAYKHTGDRAKAILKDAVSDIVPDWVLNRPKQGFGAPVGDWLQSRLGPLFRQVTQTDMMREYFNVEALALGFEERRFTRNRLTPAMWFILNFALWHRYWIEGESVDNLTTALIAA